MPDGKVWMTKNLDITTLNEETIGTYYNNDPEMGALYGRLYTWDEAVAVAASVAGWHLPTRGEWNALVEACGGDAMAGKYLKAKEGWKPFWNANLLTYVPGNGTDDYGFAALPGGDYYGGYSNNAGYNGNWWTATEVSAEVAYYRNMDSSLNYTGNFTVLKTYGFSVRLVKD
jgi:uncharacterized protein (TIGR02145 family)